CWSRRNRPQIPAAWRAGWRGPEGTRYRSGCSRKAPSRGFSRQKLSLPLWATPWLKGERTVTAGDGSAVQHAKGVKAVSTAVRAAMKGSARELAGENGRRLGGIAGRSPSDLDPVKDLVKLGSA